MKSRIIFVFVVLGLFLFATVIIYQSRTIFSDTDGERVREHQVDTRSPVLVELFTSEGCSSCPPADELLTRLDKMQPVPSAEVIALSQHVDYWNRLGWADPYSSAEFSKRQSDYAEAFKIDGNYTPQMVVDGQAEFVGSNTSKARDAIIKAAQAAKATVQITRIGNSSEAKTVDVPLQIRIDNLPPVSSRDTTEVMLAITEDNLRSNVLRGENGGRLLKHTAVVRKLSVIGKISSQDGRKFAAEQKVNFAKDWKRENLHAVVFVQEHDSRRVLGAATIRLAAE